MKPFCRHMLMLVAVLATGLVSACLPDAKDPDKATSDAGQINGDYYAAALGNIALKVQNSVVGDPSWFANTSSSSLNLAALGIDTNMLGTTVKSSICPTGSGTEVLQMTWLDGRDSTGKFTVKGMGSDAGTMIGELRTRVATDQVGLYTGGTSLAMESGSTLSIPASCANMGLPAGAPVLVFRISRPAAPVSEMSRTEYRTANCANDIRGRAMRGTMVQSRVVKYLADGTITPSSPNAGWNSDDIGQCVADTDVVGTKSALNTTGASAALGNFADIAAQGMKSMLESQLQMGCTNGTVSKDAVVDGRRDTSSKTIDTCRAVSISDVGSAINDNAVSYNADVRNVCPRYADVTRSLLAISSGQYVVNYGGIANIERVVDKVALNTDSTNQGKREQWVGRAIDCSGNESYTAACGNIPGAPGGPDGNGAGKWDYRDLGAYYDDESWLESFLGCWIGSCDYVQGGGGYTLNMGYFDAKWTIQWSSSTANRNLHAASWLDPYQYFVPNFGNLGPRLGWHINEGRNHCQIRKRELQLNCPLNYDGSREGNWWPYELPAGTNFFTTLRPGGSYNTGGMDGVAGRFYYDLLAEGAYPGQTWVNRKKCNIKGCDSWTVYAGPGLDSYIQSWGPYGDSSSYDGGGTTVQTIMMNKDGQYPDYMPTIVDGPRMEFGKRYSDAERLGLHCGRIERRDIGWPTIVYYWNCGGKGGCRLNSYWTTTTVSQVTTREWYGDNAWVGSWSRPVTVWSSSAGTWGDINQIPNPMTTWQ